MDGLPVLLNILKTVLRAQFWFWAPTLPCYIVRTSGLRLRCSLLPSYKIYTTVRRKTDRGLRVSLRINLTVQIETRFTIGWSSAFKEHLIAEFVDAGLISYLVFVNQLSAGREWLDIGEDITVARNVNLLVRGCRASLPSSRPTRLLLLRYLLHRVRALQEEIQVTDKSS